MDKKRRLEYRKLGEHKYAGAARAGVVCPCGRKCGLAVGARCVHKLDYLLAAAAECLGAHAHEVLGGMGCHLWSAQFFGGVCMPKGEVACKAHHKTAFLVGALVGAYISHSFNYIKLKLFCQI